ncbi:MAG: hypothetical protein ACK4OM_00845 [Alphaproteobacteria bacterium]
MYIHGKEVILSENGILDLSNLRINETIAADIVQNFKDNNQLTELNLQETEASFKSIKELAKLIRSSKSLRILNFGLQNINSIKLKIFYEAISQNPRILSLNSGYNIQDGKFINILTPEYITLEERITRATGGLSEKEYDDTEKTLYNILNNCKNIIFYNSVITKNYNHAFEIASKLYKNRETLCQISYAILKEFPKRRNAVKYILDHAYTDLNLNGIEQLIRKANEERKIKWSTTITKDENFQKNIPTDILKIIGHNLRPHHIIITKKQRNNEFLKRCKLNCELSVLETYYNENEEYITPESLKMAYNHVREKVKNPELEEFLNIKNHEKSSSVCKVM